MLCADRQACLTNAHIYEYQSLTSRNAAKPSIFRGKRRVPSMSVIQRNKVIITGSGTQTLLFAHGVSRHVLKVDWPL